MVEAPYILLAEDSDDDTYFARRCFAVAGAPFEVKRCADGKELCTALSSCGGKLPKAVILDLKMPLMDGFEALDWIRHQPAYQSLPVFILSSSGLEQDKMRAQQLGATEYFVKPSSLRELERMLKELAQRFSETATPH